MTRTEGESMLRFENVCAGYDGLERLHRVTAAIPSGGLTAVIGPNGCGKSTLIKCAAGILKPSGGSALLDGRSIRSIPEKERARLISYMPQSRVVPDISVRQLAAYGRYPRLKWGQNLSAADRGIIEAALRRTGLTAYAQRSVSRLSGGERQRAYIAMMLAQQTSVMLLDEPTAYLDLSAQFSLMELLAELCREGRSAVVVLHDLALALEYADNVLLMQDGRLVAQGRPEEVYAAGVIGSVFDIGVRRLSDGKYVFTKRRDGSVRGRP
jgi:ABC-type cobalamin/Fe3+-siderophores transport system ATPase subunit